MCKFFFFCILEKVHVWLSVCVCLCKCSSVFLRLVCVCVFCWGSSSSGWVSGTRPAVRDVTASQTTYKNALTKTLGKNTVIGFLVNDIPWPLLRLLTLSQYLYVYAIQRLINCSISFKTLPSYVLSQVTTGDFHFIYWFMNRFFMFCWCGWRPWYPAGCLGGSWYPPGVCGEPWYPPEVCVGGP